MKIRKGLRRFAVPIFFVVIGIIIGTRIVDSHNRSVQSYWAVDSNFPQAEFEAEIREFEREMNEVVQELHRELEVAIPQVAENPTQPPQPTIYIDNGEGNSARSSINVGRISVLMGGFGISALMLMALMTFFGKVRRSTPV